MGGDSFDAEASIESVAADGAVGERSEADTISRGTAAALPGGGR